MCQSFPLIENPPFADALLVCGSSAVRLVHAVNGATPARAHTTKEEQKICLILATHRRARPEEKRVPAPANLSHAKTAVAAVHRTVQTATIAQQPAHLRVSAEHSSKSVQLANMATAQLVKQAPHVVAVTAQAMATVQLAPNAQPMVTAPLTVTAMTVPLARLAPAATAKCVMVVRIADATGSHEPEDQAAMLGTSALDPASLATVLATAMSAQLMATATTVAVAHPATTVAPLTAIARPVASAAVMTAHRVVSSAHATTAFLATVAKRSSSAATATLIEMTA